MPDVFEVEAEEAKKAVYLGPGKWAWVEETDDPAQLGLKVEEVEPEEQILPEDYDVTEDQLRRIHTTTDILPPVEVMDRAQMCDAARESLGFKPQWEPATPEDFEKIVKKIVLNRAEQKLLKQQYDNNLRKARNEEEFLLRRYGPALQQYCLGQLNDSDNKYVEFSIGRVQFKKLPGQFIVSNSSFMQEWCKQIGSERRKRLGIKAETVYKYELTKLKKEAEVIKADGECIPGLEWQEGDENSWTIQAPRNSTL